MWNCKECSTAGNVNLKGLLYSGAYFDLNNVPEGKLGAHSPPANFPLKLSAKGQPLGAQLGKAPLLTSDTSANIIKHNGSNIGATIYPTIELLVNSDPARSLAPSMTQ